MCIGELFVIKRENINYEDKMLDIDGIINWIIEKKMGVFGVKEIIERSNSYRVIGFII